MRRLLVIVTLFALAGCARTVAAQPAPAPSPSSDTGVYVAVLQRYLGTPADSSFPNAFTTVYVLDRAYPNAADPMHAPDGGVPIDAGTQHEIAAAVPGVTFIADRASVVSTSGGCAQVKAGAILVTLGTVGGSGSDVTVGINGFVACSGATWLTYTVHRSAGGWRVTGTTGPQAVA